MDAEAESLLVNRELTRDSAIHLLERLNDPETMGTSDFVDFKSLTNDELLEAICLSGTIHDDEIDAVV